MSSILLSSLLMAWTAVPVSNWNTAPHTTVPIRDAEPVVVTAPARDTAGKLLARRKL